MLEVTTLSELTIDGKLSLGGGASSKDLFAFYGDEVRTWFHQRRADSDAIMVGAGTVRSDDPELTVRFVEGANPLRVAPTASGDLPPDCRLLNDGLPTLVAVSGRASSETIAALEERDGVEVVVCGQDQVNLPLLMQRLEDRGVRRLTVEGGSRLLHSLFQADLVDEIVIKHIPVIAGRADAPGYLRPADGQSALPLSRWELAECFAIGNVAVSIYRRGARR